jgi:3-phenylpropionate/trans-cinnamate dioxygenase ferredoxin reductase subunit
MERYHYLIIGGGMTGESAIRGIREVDAAGSIGLIGAEAHPPYNRPPLSKGLWKGQVLEEIWRKPEVQGLRLHLERSVQSLDVKAKRVADTSGTEYAFEKLLLATGGAVRRLPFGGDQIIYFRTLEDYQRLRALADRGGQIAVLGGGFIGSEIAAALSLNGKAVTMLFPDEGMCNRVFPRDLSQFLNRFFSEKGVKVLAGESASDLTAAGTLLNLKTRGGRSLQVAGVVAGIGIQPAVELARDAGLDVQDGIVVDEYLRTSHPDVFAAGDVANFFNPALGQRLRVEHEDNANTMGRLVGRNMAGAHEPYHHLPSFYSDLFELGYEAVGDLDPRLEVLEDWREPFREGTLYYLKDDRVRGVLLWNVWGQVDAARRLIADPGPFRRLPDLKGRLTG